MTNKKVNIRVGNGGDGSIGCFGCLGIIAFCIVLWALAFGVTVGGVHYRLSCSQARGVSFDMGTP